MWWRGRFLRWLSIRPTWSEFGRLVLIAYTINLATMFAVALLLRVLGSQFPRGVDSDLAGSLNTMVTEPLRALGVLAAAAAVEELFFRLIPFAAFLALVRTRRIKHRGVIPVLVATGVTFGMVHLLNYAVVTPALVAFVLAGQSVGGLLYGMLFLKYSGLRLRYAFYAFIAATAVHVLWNVMWVLPLMLGLT